MATGTGGGRQFRLGIIVEGDERGGVRAVQATQRELQKLSRQQDENRGSAGRHTRAIEQQNEVLNRTIKIVTAAAVAYGTLRLGRRIIDETVEYERVTRQLETVLESTGGSARWTRDQLVDMANALQGQTNFAATSVMEAQTLLLGFGEDLQEILPDALQLSADMAERLGTDIPQAAQRIGRALAAPERAVQTFRRQGIALREETEELIDSLVRQGRTGEAQVVVLEALERSYGGAAAAARDSFGGALQGVRNAFSDLLIGQDGLSDAKDALNDLEAILTDPSTIEGAQKLTGVLITGFGAVVRFASQIHGFMEFIGESVARTLGHVADLEAARDRLAEIDRMLSAPVVMPWARQSLQEERGQIVSMIATFEELEEQAARRRANAGQDAAGDDQRASARDRLRGRTDELATSTGELSDADQRLLEQIARTTRQLELMSQGYDASTAQAMAQQEASSGLQRQYLQLQQQVRDLTEQRRTEAQTVQELDRIYGAHAELITGVDADTRRYQQTISELSELLAFGRISQDDFNAALDRLDTRRASDGLAEFMADLDSLQFGSQFAQGFDDASRAAGDLLSGINGLIDAQSRFAALREEAGDDERKLAAIAEASQRAQIGLYGDMAQAARGFFSEGSRGYEALTVAEQTFRAVELALAAQNLAQKLGFMAAEEAAVVSSAATKATAEGTAAVASAGVGTPFPANLAAVGATVALLAGLGVALRGSGGGGAAAAPVGAGSVLGDPMAISESIANSTQITADATSSILGVNQGMLRSLRSIEQSSAGLGRLVARTGVEAPGMSMAAPMFDGMGRAVDVPGMIAGGPMQLAGDLLNRLSVPIVGDLLGGIGGALSSAMSSLGNALFGGRESIRGQGLQIDEATVGELLEDMMVRGFARIRRSGGVFGGSSYRDEFFEVDQAFADQFGLLFDSILDTVLSGVEGLGLDAERALQGLLDVELGELRIQTDRPAAEVQEEISNAFSAIFDQLSSDAVGFISDFQQVGEGAGETLVRIASNVQVAEAGLSRLGLDLTTGLEGDIDRAQRIAQRIPGLMSEPYALLADNLRQEAARLRAEISTDLIDAAGGFDEFAGLTGDFVQRFRSEAEQLDILTGEVTARLGQLGLELPATRDEFVALVEGLDLTDEASRRLLVPLLELAPALDEVFGSAGRLDDMLAGVARDMAQLDMTPLEIELARIEQRMRDQIETARGLGASERELDLIRQFAVRQGVNALKADFEDLAGALSGVSNSIQADIQRLRASAAGFDSVGAAGARVDDLRAQLAGATSAREQAAVVDDLRRAIVDRFDTERREIEEANRARQQAHQSTMRNLDAQRQAVEGLRRYIDSLGLAQTSPLTALERFEEAEQLFEQALAGGDAQQLQQAAEALLRENREVFGVSDPAVEIFNRVRDELTARADQLGRATQSVSDAGVQRAVATNTSAISGSIDQLRAAAIAELQELDELLAELLDGEQESFEDQLEALAAQFDQSREHHVELVGLWTQQADAQAQRDEQRLESLRQQSDQLRALIEETQASGRASADLLRAQKDHIDRLVQQLQSEIGRMARAVERAVTAGDRA